MTDEEMRYYSKALDEIFALRAALMYEAEQQEKNLAFKCFPKSRRVEAERSISRMRRAALKARPIHHEAMSYKAMDALFTRWGGRYSLTNSEWMAEVDGD